MDIGQVIPYVDCFMFAGVDYDICGFAVTAAPFADRVICEVAVTADPVAA